MPSFKVPCPSCEAQVLIKNPDLVGTKVECPKCKYRFKVEEPAPEPAPDEKGKGKKDKGGAVAVADPPATKTKKKGKSKTTAIAAVVGAVLVLGVVGFFVFGGKKKPETPSRPNTGGFVNTGGQGGTNTGEGTEQGGDQEKKDEKKDEPRKLPKSNLPRSTANVTNLLPGQSVAVYRVNVELARQSPFFNSLVDANAELFKTSMGFEIDYVDSYIHCSVGADRAAFGVIATAGAGLGAGGGHEDEPGAGP